MNRSSTFSRPMKRADGSARAGSSSCRRAACRSATRRPLSAQGAASEPGVGAALCSMAVQDIGVDFAAGLSLATTLCAGMSPRDPGQRLMGMRRDAEAPVAGRPAASLSSPSADRRIGRIQDEPDLVAAASLLGCARSRTCRNRPPTGARRQCRMRKCSVKRRAPDALRRTLVDVNGVTRQQGVIGRDLYLVNEAVDPPRDPVAALARALGVATGDRNRRLDRHAGHVGVLAGQADLAQDEERAVLLQCRRLPADRARTRAELGADGALEVDRGAVAGLHLADERHGDIADLIDGIEARQVRLAVDEHPQFVAGIEQIGPAESATACGPLRPAGTTCG